MKSSWVALAALLVASPLAAQEDTGEPVLIEALVVNARTPGPAWWSVSKGEAKVWVLGLSGKVPPTSQWDAAAFERRLKASRRLIHSDPTAKTKFSSETLKADRPWIEELTAEERDRLTELAAQTKRPVTFYTAYRPNFGALLLNGELQRRTKTYHAGPDVLLARAKALKAQSIAVQGKLREGLKGSFSKGDRDGLVCLRWVLSQRDLEGAARVRTQAWARGDVRVLVSPAMTYDPCVQSMKALNTSIEDQETALADQIAATLDRGEGAVALVGLIPLLRQRGVLDQLRARGYVVRTPAVDSD